MLAKREQIFMVLQKMCPCLLTFLSRATVWWQNSFTIRFATREFEGKTYQDMIIKFKFVRL